MTHVPSGSLIFVASVQVQVGDRHRLSSHLAQEHMQEKRKLLDTKFRQGLQLEATTCT